jgi:hypothetical protein
MTEFTDLHIKCLLGMAGVPVVSKVGTSGGWPSTVIAMYIPNEGTIIKRLNNGTEYKRPFLRGIFVFSIPDAYNGGFGISSAMDDNTFLNATLELEILTKD